MWLAWSNYSVPPTVFKDKDALILEAGAINLELV